MNELNVFSNGQTKEMSVASAATALATTRQAQEVQAAMVVAKKFPRDEEKSMEKILAACTRKTLAESAIYSYPRGGTEVTGPSIRLAECMAQNWGNIDFGYIELEQKQGESTVMAYAWDLETNTRQSKVFTVPHRRETKNGSYPLTDSRDIYELIANQAARRVRSCVLAVIPGDVIEAAVQQCELTMKAGMSAKPIGDLIAEMIQCFSKYDVTEEMLSAYIGKNIEAFNEKDVLKLRKIYGSIKDGILGNDYFLNRMKESAMQVDESTGEVIEPQPKPQPEQKKGKAKKEEPEPVKEAVGFDDL